MQQCRSIEPHQCRIKIYVRWWPEERSHVASACPLGYNLYQKVVLTNHRKLVLLHSKRKAEILSALKTRYLAAYFKMSAPGQFNCCRCWSTGPRCVLRFIICCKGSGFVCSWFADFMCSLYQGVWGWSCCFVFPVLLKVQRQGPYYVANVFISIS